MTTRQTKREELAESLTKVASLCLNLESMHDLPSFSLPSMSSRRKTYANRRSFREKTFYEGCVRSTLQFKLLGRSPSLHVRKSYGRRRNSAANRRSWLTAAKTMEVKLGAEGNSVEAWQLA